MILVVVASSTVVCGGRNGRRKMTCQRRSPCCCCCQPFLGPWFGSPMEGEVLVRLRRCVVAGVDGCWSRERDAGSSGGEREVNCKPRRVEGAGCRERRCDFCVTFKTNFT